MTIKVTQKHIDKGDPGESCTCPIALAIMESADISGILVDGDNVFNIDNWDERGVDACVLPDTAIKFISNFDRYIPVNPFEFELEI